MIQKVTEQSETGDLILFSDYPNLFQIIWNKFQIIIWNNLVLLTVTQHHNTLMYLCYILFTIRQTDEIPTPLPSTSNLG